MVLSKENSNQESVREGKRYALVVGVDHAPSSDKPPLRHAIRDAKALADVLRQPYCGFELPDENILLEEKATTRIIQEKLLTFVQKCTPDDSLLFYFNGHGIPVNVRNSQEIYLCTTDFSRELIDLDENHHVSFQWLREKLYRKCKAEKVLLILECCFAGEYSTSGLNHYLSKMKKDIEDYLDISGEKDPERPGGFRQALTATGHIGPDGTALASDGFLTPSMTELILPVLSGEIETNDTGEITVSALDTYLEQKQRNLHFSRRASLSGDKAGRSFILATHVTKEKKQEIHHQEIHIPRARNRQSFQERKDEFQKIEDLMFGKTQPTRLGLVGMAGIGKSELACEIAYRFKDRFPGGIFWFDAQGKSLIEWQRQLANLARYVKHLLPKFDPQNDSEEYVARLFCKYLAKHVDALLVADNVSNPSMLLNDLHQIAGEEITCALIYTSQDGRYPHGSQKYDLSGLDVAAAQNLLLTNLSSFQAADVQAAQKIIERCYHHPLTLVIINTCLREDHSMTLPLMAEILEKQGPWPFDERFPVLYPALQAQWDRVENERTKRLFLLALCFPNEHAIPIPLVGMASELGEEVNHGPLSNARLELEKLNLATYNAELCQLQFHSLIYTFGQRYLVSKIKQEKNSFFTEAALRLIEIFENLHWLDHEAQKSYNRCLNQVKQAIIYIKALDATQETRLAFIESILKKERERLEHSDLWPQQLPGFFYQQIFNRSVQKEQPFPLQENAHPWLRLIQPVKPEEPKRFTVRRQRENVFESGFKVTSVAFSPDNSKVLLSIYEEGYEKKDPHSKRVVFFSEAWMLDAASGDYLAIFEGHTQEITQALFSPDGSHVLTGSTDTTARLWDAETGRQLHCFEGHSDAITSIAFSPDGSQIVTGSANRTALLWDIQNKHRIYIFDEHKDEVTSVAFSPDGKYLLTGSQDTTARLWEVSTGKLLGTFSKHLAGVTHVAFSSDSSKILTASEDKTARTWNTWTGEALNIFQGHTDNVVKAIFSPDNSFIITASYDGIINRWGIDGKRQTPVQRQSLGSVTDITLAANGEQLLAGYSAGHVLIWDLKPKPQENVFEETAQPVHQTKLTKTALDHNGTFLIAVDQDTAWLWNVPYQRPLKHLQKYFYSCVAFNKNRFVALGTRDNKLIVYTNEEMPIVLNCSSRFKSEDKPKTKIRTKMRNLIVTL